MKRVMHYLSTAQASSSQFIKANLITRKHLTHFSLPISGSMSPPVTAFIIGHRKKRNTKGGNQVLYGSIGRQLVYPVKARRQGIEGKVFIEFKVDKLGRLKDARILKG